MNGEYLGRSQTQWPLFRVSIRAVVARTKTPASATQPHGVSATTNYSHCHDPELLGKAIIMLITRACANYLSHLVLADVTCHQHDVLVDFVVLETGFIVEKI